MWSSNPPLCAAHGGGSLPVGAPKGNKNAQTHGAYATFIERADHVAIGEGAGIDLGARIADLDRRIERLTVTGDQA